MSVRRVGVLLECDGPEGGGWQDCPDGANWMDAVPAPVLRKRASVEDGWVVGLPGGVDRCGKCSGARPCSFPGCGKPSAYLPHADGRGAGWRHVDPADETDSHVGYPMPRSQDTTNSGS